MATFRCKCGVLVTVEQPPPDGVVLCDDCRRATGPSAAAPGTEPAPRGAGWPWIAAAIGLVAGREIASVAGFFGAQAAGVTAPGATAHVAALVKAREAAQPAGALIGAVAGYVSVRLVRPRRFALPASAALGLLAGAIAGAVVGFVAGYF